MVLDDHNGGKAHADAEKRAEKKALVVGQLKTLLTMINVFLQRVKTIAQQPGSPRPKTTKGVKPEPVSKQPTPPKK